MGCVSQARQAVHERWPELRPEHWTLTGLDAMLAEQAPCSDRLAEMALAHGCAGGDHAALRVLEREFLVPMEGVLTGQGFSPSVVAEAMQQIRVTLLVDHGDGPPLLGYRGRGPLAGWFRTACTRAAIRQRNREQSATRREHNTRSQPEPEAPESHPSETAEVVGRLREIVRALAPRDRDLLRQRYYEGLGLEQIGRTYGVHASTVARWVARIELHIRTELRRGVCADLRVSPSACESILRGAQHHPALELSLVLRRTFEGSPAAP